MKINEIHMKIIALGLLPIFIILVIALPGSTGKDILLAGIMLAALAASFIGRSLQKKEADGEDDLLAIPPKKK
jgi:hypothetical protein